MRKRSCCFCVLALFLVLLLSGCGIGEGIFDKPVEEASNKEEGEKQLTPTPIVDSFGKVTAEALLESLTGSEKEYGTAGFYLKLEFIEDIQVPEQSEAETGGMVLQMEGSIAANPVASYMSCRVFGEEGEETVSEQLMESYTLLQSDGSVSGYLYDAESDLWLEYEEDGFADLSENVSLVDFSAVSNRQIFDSLELVVTETEYMVYGTLALTSFCGVTDMGMDMKEVSEAIPGFEDIVVSVEYVFDRDTRQIESFRAITDLTGGQVADLPVFFEMSMAVDFEITPEGAHIEIPENLMKLNEK